ncbi:GAF domain-containing protein [Lyngbya sp. CCY1209]|uniref:GAF domain-containing protein n=1 Tax=Lyngbya sp. CCY1209 TaxID=2886103 RepID=UPI002D20DDFB|nr:GAF domain-containing protein [Lyngbya sp. CCY1209]MEB3883776.1 GAF domain-containing protein [Lyngbya sp. CCY1209]
MNLPSISGDPNHENSHPNCDRTLQSFVDRLKRVEDRDNLVQTTLNRLRKTLGCDRIVLYYFYRRWEGQVTFESLRYIDLSIYGSTGADDCFNDTYAQLYLQGRIRAISDIETADIDPCHREFLSSLKVRANLAVPVLTDRGLWGLLIAHHCRDTHAWTEAEIEEMKRAAETVSNAPAIREL